MVVGVVVYILRGLSTPVTSSETGGTRVAQSMVYVVLALMVGLGAICNLLRGKIFPIVAFSMGSGVDRQRHVTHLRSLLGVSFILSVLASLVASVIFQLVSN